MSGVVVEVRVKEGQEIKKGDPVCGKYKYIFFSQTYCFSDIATPISPERHEG